MNIEQDDSSSDTVDVEETDPNDQFDLSSFVQVDIPNSPKTGKPARKRATDTDLEDPLTTAEQETSALQVRQRFMQGCECQGDCFSDLQPENVYRHRLNVAELTKEEHDMYLMGVTMACLANRKETGRHKERIRQRATYVYQGTRVCLDAFLYLENVTQYHLKRIRNHVMTNGVTPRVHGNIGKKPHNTFSLDMYKDAENFVKSVLADHGGDIGKPIVVLAETRASIYQRFKQKIPPDGKIMGYSTFRHFMKKQFPHVRFVPTFTNVRNRKRSRPEDAGTAETDSTKILVGTESAAESEDGWALVMANSSSKAGSGVDATG